MLSFIAGVIYKVKNVYCDKNSWKLLLKNVVSVLIFSYVIKSCLRKNAACFHIMVLLPEIQITFRVS